MSKAKKNVPEAIFIPGFDITGILLTLIGNAVGAWHIPEKEVLELHDRLTAIAKLAEVKTTKEKP